MKKAIYAFSGDPITYGHIDIVKRALKLFDKLVVAIGVNADKSYTFSLEERETMARKVLGHLENVEVTSFQGLLVDYAYEKGVDVIVKGLRDENDYNYEILLHQLGESQSLGIESVLLPARQNLIHISSSAVKALQHEQGMIHEYVPLHVKQKLEEKISGQYIIEVTGSIGSGKTYVSRKLKEYAEEKGMEVHHIDFDTQIVRKILSELKEDNYQKTRDQIADKFGSEVMLEDGMINRKVLGEIVFGDMEKLEKLNNLMRKPMLNRLRKEIYGKKGLIILDAALFAELDMLFLSNNNVLLVGYNEEIQRQRLKERDLSDEQINRRLISQHKTENKREIILTQIDNDNQGKLWEVDNSDARHMDQIFNQILINYTKKISV